MPTIVSVIPTAQIFPIYERKEGILVGKALVSIPAGRGTIDPKTGYSSSPAKVEISESIRKQLENSKLFMRMVKSGGLKIVNQSAKMVDVEEVAKDMAPKTNSDLLTKEDLKKEAKKKTAGKEGLTDVQIATGAGDASKD